MLVVYRLSTAIPVVLFEHTPLERIWMNDSYLQLPETVDLFGITFLINGVTLSIAALPLIWLCIAGFYIYHVRRTARTIELKPTPLLLTDSLTNLYQYEYVFPSSRNVSVEREDALYNYHHNYHQTARPSVYADFLNNRTASSGRGQYNTSVVDVSGEEIPQAYEDKNDGFFVDEMTQPVKIPSFILNPVATLTCISLDAHLPEIFTIGSDEPLLFGRQRDMADHIIPDMRISRRHAAIIPTGDKLYIRDEGSSGGTFVNQHPVKPTEQVLLNENDIVGFNNIAYRLNFMQ